MKPRHKRLALLGGGVAIIALAAGLIFTALSDNLVFFYSPTQVYAKEAPVDRGFRVGGLVEVGSVGRAQDGLSVRFRVTDTARSVTVEYRGILPDLFREGKGVVAQGRLDADGVFVADQVLAKHDENYMPPEAAMAIEDAKHGRHGAASIKQ
jgi:cytochrome c-type biogenesis protein CcmE